MIALTSPDLSEKVFPQVIAAVDGLEDISERTRCLTALLPRLPDALKPEVKTKALASAALSPDFIQRASLVASIDPQLRLQDVPAAIGRINETIQAAVDSIPEQQMQSPLGNFGADVEYGAVQRLLSLFGDVLDQPQIEQVLKGVRSIRFPRPRAHALAALATRLSGPLKDRVRGEALDAAWECENIDVMLSSWYTGAASTLADVLTILYADISEAQALEAAAKVRSMADPFSRAAATYHLLMSFIGFPDPNRNLVVFNELLNDALNAISSLEREWDWADLAGKFYPLAGVATKNAILQRMPTLKDGGAVVAILSSFASDVSDAQWPELFRFVAQMPPNEVNKEFIQGIGPGGKVSPEIIAQSGGRGARAKALALLAPHVPNSLLGDALDLALELDENRTAAIAPLLARIAKLPPANALPLFRKLIASLAAGPRREYLQCAYALVPVITSLGGLAAAAEAIRAIDDCGRWWP